MSNLTITVLTVDAPVTILVQDIVPGDAPVTVLVEEVSQEPVTVIVQDVATTPGPAGPAGADSTVPGPQGPAGADGASATVAVGTVTTGDAGTAAAVVNSGTSSAVVLDFTIPRGADGVGGGGGSGKVLQYLTTAFTVANQATTYQTVPGLGFTVPAGAHCAFKLFAAYFGPTSGDLSIQAATSFIPGENYFADTTKESTNVTAQSFLPEGFFGPAPLPQWDLQNTANLPKIIVIEGFIIGGAADSIVEWKIRQLIANASASGFKAGSYVEYSIQ